MDRRLTTCPGCEQLIFEGTCVCPHCGEQKACRGAGRLSVAVVALGLALAPGCQDGGFTDDIQADYGVAITDDDGDGYDAEEDCDDGDDTIYPGAPETADDGVDSNCDGDDNT